MYFLSNLAFVQLFFVGDSYPYFVSLERVFVKKFLEFYFIFFMKVYKKDCLIGILRAKQMFYTNEILNKILIYPN